MLGIKLALLVALFATAFACGALPLRRRGEDASARRLLEGGNAFAAGIFLGARFVPPLPHADAPWAPLGVGAGAAVGALAGGARLVGEAAFLSLAAGTFAYVATLDILREEFHDPDGRLAKWLWVVAGAGLMALLALWV